MKIKVNPLTIFLVATVAVIGDLKLYIIAYTVMAIHEISHLVAATCIGLKPQCITFSPFGLQLKLNNKLINSISDEIILYSAGPLVNAVLALFSIMVNMEIFYKLNITLFIMNLLPIIPLDGGIIVLRLLSYRWGYKIARTILNIVSLTAGVGVLCVATYFFFINRINISLFIIAIFFIGNLLTAKEMYNRDIVYALSSGKKRTNKVKFVIIDREHSISDAIKNISPIHQTFVIKLDGKGKIKEIISEKELLYNIDFSL